MAEVPQQLFFNPPIVIARLGGSTTPLAAYAWAQPQNPRTDGETVVVPQWSLRVLTDGTVAPFLPTEIELRDGDLIRPVAPFLELWAGVGEPGSAPETWRDVPVTPALLAQSNIDTSALLFRVDARNNKAARRMRNPALAFGTFPAVEVRGNEHGALQLEGRSPPGVNRPMIPVNRTLELGSIQVLRSRSQPQNRVESPWIDSVNVETIRLRFTPARGRFYGPPQAAIATSASNVPAVPATNAFLNPNAGWWNGDRETNPFVYPANTCDTVSTRSRRSLGVIDDTCEARIDVELRLPGPPVRTLRAHANVFVAPPDFAPDRRPFLSLADELNDRDGAAGDRNKELAGADLDAWVEDLFERVYETASLFNVDFFRRDRGLERLRGPSLAAMPIPGDGIKPVSKAMGSRDALRDPQQRIVASTPAVPLPLSDRVRMRHRTLSDVRQLKNFVLQSPGRMEKLVRGPFEVEQREDVDATTMRMPPFMRQSNALPLTLAAWQYDLLMRWIQQVAPVVPGAIAPVVPDAIAPLSREVEDRRAAVLRRLDAAGSQ